MFLWHFSTPPPLAGLMTKTTTTFTTTLVASTTPVMTTTTTTTPTPPTTGEALPLSAARAANFARSVEFWGTRASENRFLCV